MPNGVLYSMVAAYRSCVYYG